LAWQEAGLDWEEAGQPRAEGARGRAEAARNQAETARGRAWDAQIQASESTARELDQRSNDIGGNADIAQSEIDRALATADQISRGTKQAWDEVGQARGEVSVVQKEMVLARREVVEARRAASLNQEVTAREYDMQPQEGAENPEEERATMPQTGEGWLHSPPDPVIGAQVGLVSERLRMRRTGAGTDWDTPLFGTKHALDDTIASQTEALKAARENAEKLHALYDHALTELYLKNKTDFSEERRHANRILASRTYMSDAVIVAGMERIHNRINLCEKHVALATKYNKAEVKHDPIPYGDYTGRSDSDLNEEIEKMKAADVSNENAKMRELTDAMERVEMTPYTAGGIAEVEKMHSTLKSRGGDVDKLAAAVAKLTTASEQTRGLTERPEGPTTSIAEMMASLPEAAKAKKAMQRASGYAFLNELAGDPKFTDVIEAWSTVIEHSAGNEHSALARIAERGAKMWTPADIKRLAQKIPGRIENRGDLTRRLEEAYARVGRSHLLDRALNRLQKMLLTDEFDAELQKYELIAKYCDAYDRTLPTDYDSADVSRVKVILNGQLPKAQDVADLKELSKRWQDAKKRFKELTSDALKEVFFNPRYELLSSEWEKFSSGRRRQFSRVGASDVCDQILEQSELEQALEGAMSSLNSSLPALKKLEMKGMLLTEEYVARAVLNEQKTKAKKEVQAVQSRLGLEGDVGVEEIDECVDNDCIQQTKKRLIDRLGVLKVASDARKEKYPEWDVQAIEGKRTPKGAKEALEKLRSLSFELGGKFEGGGGRLSRQLESYEDIRREIMGRYGQYVSQLPEKIGLTKLQMIRAKLDELDTAMNNLPPSVTVRPKKLAASSADGMIRNISALTNTATGYMQRYNDLFNLGDYAGNSHIDLYTVNMPQWIEFDKFVRFENEFKKAKNKQIKLAKRRPKMQMAVDRFKFFYKKAINTPEFRHPVARLKAVMQFMDKYTSKTPEKDYDAMSNRAINWLQETFSKPNILFSTLDEFFEKGGLDVLMRRLENPPITPDPGSVGAPAGPSAGAPAGTPAPGELRPMELDEGAEAPARVPSKKRPETPAGDGGRKPPIDATMEQGPGATGEGTGASSGSPDEDSADDDAGASSGSSDDDAGASSGSSDDDASDDDAAVDDMGDVAFNGVGDNGGISDEMSLASAMQPGETMVVEGEARGGIAVTQFGVAELEDEEPAETAGQDAEGQDETAGQDAEGQDETAGQDAEGQDETAGSGEFFNVAVIAAMLVQRHQPAAIGAPPRAAAIGAPPQFEAIEDSPGSATLDEPQGAEVPSGDAAREEFAIAFRERLLREGRLTERGRRTLEERNAQAQARLASQIRRTIMFARGMTSRGAAGMTSHRAAGKTRVIRGGPRLPSILAGVLRSPDSDKDASAASASDEDDDEEWADAPVFDPVEQRARELKMKDTEDLENEQEQITKELNNPDVENARDLRIRLNIIRSVLYGINNAEEGPDRQAVVEGAKEMRKHTRERYRKRMIRRKDDLERTDDKEERARLQTEIEAIRLILEEMKMNKAPRTGEAAGPAQRLETELDPDQKSKPGQKRKNTKAMMKMHLSMIGAPQ